MNALLKNGLRVWLLGMLVGAMLALLTGCDQLFPYDKEPYSVCDETVHSWAYNEAHTDSIPVPVTTCTTHWRRAD